MPSLAGNGAAHTGPNDAAGAALRARLTETGAGAVLGISGGSGPSSGSASPLNAVAPLVSASDSWLVQKLKSEWSSCDLGPLLTKERLSDVVTSFPHLDTPIKVRLLLAFLSMRKEDFEASKFAVVEIVDAAEKDHEEWVKVSAGIVNQHLFMSRDGAESGTFLHEQLARASATVLDAVRGAPSDSDHAAARTVVIEDFFCHENAYLSGSVRPELAVQPAAHFTIAEGAPNHGNRLGGVHNSSSSSGSGSASSSSQATSKAKPPTHRPQLPRPGAVTGASSASSLQARTTPPASKPVSLPPKKNMTELSSEIRRKADAGRFKRQRSRISVIDLDEVKQIESEKALKAEEQKKRLKATKEEKKTTGSSAAGDGATGVDTMAGGAEDGEKKDDGHDGARLGQMQEAAYGDHDDHHESDRDDGDAAYRASQDHHRHGSGAAVGGGGYAQDGTQALLHAAFHSTGDVMKEVVAQQQHQQPYQHQHQHQQQQLDYYHRSASTSQQQQQQQQQPLFATHGFEPEDAHGGYNTNAYGYGSGYTSHFGDQAPPYADQQQQYAPNSGAPGFVDDQVDQQPPGQQRYERSRDRGGFLDGPPEYWR